MPNVKVKSRIFSVVTKDKSRVSVTGQQNMNGIYEARKLGFAALFMLF